MQSAWTVSDLCPSRLLFAKVKAEWARQVLLTHPYAVWIDGGAFRLDALMCMTNMTALSSKPKLTKVLSWTIADPPTTAKTKMNVAATRNANQTAADKTQPSSAPAPPKR
jgi:hypothetical protein